MNPVDKDHRQVKQTCPGEIIEIGAVKLDERGREISCFKEYVRPKYAKDIDATCQELTGITMDTVRDAQGFTPVFRRFLAWCGETGEMIMKCMHGVKTTGVNCIMKCVLNKSI